MSFHPARTLLSRATMALHSAADTSKLILAPAGSRTPQAQGEAEKLTLHDQAEQFTLGKLTRGDLEDSPTAQFRGWFSQAQRATRPSSGERVVRHPEACALSTAELPSGRVSSRMVYLKELDGAGGFVVYTNLGTSRKASDLASNPRASLLFFWEGLERQVRVEGSASRLTPRESQVYFDTRARGSRVGAWASRQSEVLRPSGDGRDDGRAVLEARVGEVEERFAGQESIPVPDFWGGLRIVPDRMEFWQGRESRLHDRFAYDREGEDGWRIERLSP